MTTGHVTSRIILLTAAAATVAAAALAAPAAVAAMSAVMDTTTGRLAGAAPEMDGTTVRFQGEAIGEALRADAGHVWVNVLDEGTAIGVWVEREIADEIERFGRWDQRGATIRVTGTFNIGCDQHGGDLDVHAATFEIIDQGGPIERPVAWWKALVGLGGLALAAGLGFLYRFRRQHELRLT